MKKIGEESRGWCTESKRAIKIDEIRCNKAASDGTQTKTKRSFVSHDNKHEEGRIRICIILQEQIENISRLRSSIAQIGYIPIFHERRDRSLWICNSVFLVNFDVERMI